MDEDEGLNERRTRVLRFVGGTPLQRIDEQIDFSLEQPPRVIEGLRARARPRNQVSGVAFDQSFVALELDQEAAGARTSRAIIVEDGRLMKSTRAPQRRLFRLAARWAKACSVIGLTQIQPSRSAVA